MNRTTYQTDLWRQQCPTLTDDQLLANWGDFRRRACIKWEGELPFEKSQVLWVEIVKRGLDAQAADLLRWESEKFYAWANPLMKD